MNYLQLCNRLHGEMNDSGTGLTAVINQTGRYGKIVNAIREAWIEIQDDNWDSAFFGMKPKADPADADTFYDRHDPQVLTEQLDTPFIPEQYQMIIVYQAMKKQSLSLNAPELRAIADEGYAAIKSKMVNRYIGADWGKSSEPVPVSPLP